MKVLLSWLREFAPDRRRPPSARPRPRRSLGIGRRGRWSASARGLDGIVVARVLDAAPAPRAPTDPAGRRRRRRRRGARRSWCGAFNMAVGDLVPLATVGTIMPDGMEIGRAQDPRRVLERDAVLAAGARPRRRPRRHPHPARAAVDPGTPINEALGDRGRRPLRPRDQPEPARRHVGRRRRPRPRRLVRGAVLAARPARSATTRRAHDRRPGDASRSSTPTCAAASSPGCSAASPSGRRRRGSPAASRCSACGRSTTSSTCRTT